MSHVATVRLVIQHLDCLERAVESLGAVFHRNKDRYKWYGTHVGDYAIPEGMTASQLGHCLHAIGRKDGIGYEVGVIKNPVGPGMTLIYDFFGGGGHAIEDIVGKGCCKLKQAYATEVALKQARMQGFMVNRKTLQDGTVQLQLTR